jgi:hypothetical protein
METTLLFLEGFLLSFCISRAARRNLKIIALSERLRQRDCGVRRDARRGLHGESMAGSRSVTDTSLHPLKIALAQVGESESQLSLPLAKRAHNLSPRGLNGVRSSVRNSRLAVPAGTPIGSPSC